MSVKTDTYGALPGRPTRQLLADPLTVAIINFNGKHHLRECLESVRQADGPIEQVIVVDDCSTDRSPEFVRCEFPWVTLIELPTNQGPAAARNAALQSAKTRLVALLDNDVLVDRHWLVPLIEALASDEGAIICSSRVLVYERPEILDRDGDEAHFVGMPTLRKAGTPVREMHDLNPTETGSLSGISVLIDTSRMRESVAFDTDYFYNFEDLDFCLANRILGHKCLVVPRSVVYHKYLSGGVPGLSHDPVDYSARRAFYVFRNRWFILMKFYTLRTLVVLAPALLLFELCTAAFAVKRKVFKTYLGAWRSFLVGLPRLLKKRRTIQRSRVRPDSALLSAHALTLGPGTVQGTLSAWFARAVDSLLQGYWLRARGLLAQSLTGPDGQEASHLGLAKSARPGPQRRLGVRRWEKRPDEYAA